MSRKIILMIAISVSKTTRVVLQQRKRKHIVYPNLQTAIRPVEHSKDLLVPKPPDQEMWSSSSENEHSSDETEELHDSESKSKPILFSQEALNDLCRNFPFNQGQK